MRSGSCLPACNLPSSLAAAPDRPAACSPLPSGRPSAPCCLARPRGRRRSCWAGPPSPSAPSRLRTATGARCCTSSAARTRSGSSWRQRWRRTRARPCASPSRRCRLKAALNSALCCVCSTRWSGQGLALDAQLGHWQGAVQLRVDPPPLPLKNRSLAQIYIPASISITNSLSRLQLYAELSCIAAAIALIAAPLFLPLSAH